ncbi:MAG: serine hydrolase [Planctomycetota bacterium]
MSVKTAIIQYEYQDANSIGIDDDRVEEFVRQAAGNGAQLVIAPETCFYRYQPWEQNGVTILDLADNFDFLKKKFSCLADELDICLVIGLREPSGDTNQPVYNTALFYGSDGSILRKQHKIVPSNKEMAWTKAGKPGVFQSPYGRTAMMICKTAKTPWWSTYNDDNIELFVLISGDGDATSFTTFDDICSKTSCYGILANQVCGDGDKGRKGNSAWGYPDGKVDFLGGGEKIFYNSLPLRADGNSNTIVFPGADWEETTPESQGVNSKKLNKAMSYLAGECGDGGTSEAVVIRNGYIIWKGSDIDKSHNVWSCTKSFTSTVLGLLIDDGKCSLDTFAKDYAASMQQHYPGVKLSHFATMTSGYQAKGDPEINGHGQTYTPFDGIEPLFSQPGSKYVYWDSAMNQFANVLTRIAGEPIENLFKQRIADPIGMNPTKWDWKDWGNIDGLVVNGGAGNKSKGIYISAAEIARFGHLFLNKGNWNGRQLVSRNWVEKATSIQVSVCRLGYVKGADGPGEYGFNWWINGMKPNGQHKWPDAPQETFAASGYNNNKCFVIPEWKMVVVRLGTDGNIKDVVYNTFLKKVGEAITSYQLSTNGIAFTRVSVLKNGR